MRILRSVSLLALASCALSASAQNLVVNGGFETGDFSGYTLTGNSLGVDVVGGLGTNGGPGAVFSNIGRPAILTQTIASATGASYTFSFDAYSYRSGSGNSFSASFGGQNVVPASALPGKNFNDFTHYSFNVVATSASTTLRFEIYNTPSNTFLDNVSVVADPISPAVPGPVAALPFALMALRRRKRA